MKCYLAGPYTAAPEGCTILAIEIADELMSLGYTPYVPHLSHYQHAIRPRPYEDWMKLDFEWLAACDVVFRMQGKSSGADREVSLARVLLIPVVYTVGELLKRFPADMTTFADLLP